MNPEFRSTVTGAGALSPDGYFFSRVLSLFRCLATYFECDFVHPDRQDYYMTYYMKLGPGRPPGPRLVPEQILSQWFHNCLDEL